MELDEGGVEARRVRMMYVCSIVDAELRMGEQARGRGWEGRLSWVGAWTLEIMPDGLFTFFYSNISLK